jgi:hypothetical protein
MRISAAAARTSGALRVAVPALGLALALACGGPREESLDADLGEVVADLITALERRKVEQVMDRVALEFRSAETPEQPSLDYGAVRSIIQEFLLLDEALGARAEGLRVDPPEPDGSRRVRADVWFAPGVSLRDESTALPAGAVRYAFDLRFELLDGRWRAVGGSFERSGAR